MIDDVNLDDSSHFLHHQRGERWGLIQGLIGTTLLWMFAQLGDCATGTEAETCPQAVEHSTPGSVH